MREVTYPFSAAVMILAVLKLFGKGRISLGCTIVSGKPHFLQEKYHTSEEHSGC